MLRVTTTSITDDTRCQKATYSLQGKGTVRIAHVTSRTVVVGDFRPDSDLLRQGSVFDQFGNKAVQHRQWHGYLRAIPPSEVWRSSDPPTWRGWVPELSPLVCRIGVQDWIVLPLGDQMIWHYEEPGSEYSLICATSAGTDTAVRSIWFRIRWYRSGKKWLLTITGLSSDGPVCNAIADRYYHLSHVLPDSSSAKEFVPSITMMYSLARILFREASAYWCQQYIISRKDMGKAFRFEGEYPSYSNWSRPKLEANLRTISEETASNHNHAWTTTELSSHAREVIERVNDFSSNSLAYISDLREIGSTIKTALGVFEVGLNPKSLADLWLSGRFGDRLTLADTKELFTSLNRAVKRGSGPTKARAVMRKTDTTVLTGIPVSHQRVSTIIVRTPKNKDLMESVESLMRWDLWPTLENTWDLIPFSFVVDWFLSISDILSQIDAAVEAPYLKPLTQYVSDKSIFSVDYRDDGLAGSLRQTYYRRGRYDVLADVRPFERTPSDIGSFSVVNLFDAGALLIQTV